MLAAPLGARAQAADSLHRQLDYIFAPLDKSQVPTRLLAEYGTPLVKLPPYNGMLGPHK